MKFGFMTAASVALGACSRPVEHQLVSQFPMPEYQLPGQALYWATTCGQCGGGCGVSIKTTSGRAIKMEGIPGHPINRGKLCARGQSTLQALYHPDRMNKAVDWKATFTSLTDQMKAENQPLWIVGTLGGTLGGMLAEMAKTAGAKIWVLDYPSSLNERRVIKAITKKAELPFYDLAKADYIVTFGGDFLSYSANPVHANLGYGHFRQGEGRDRGTMVSVASRINQTVANCDKWLPCRAGTEGWVALAVGNLLAESGRGPWPEWAKSVSLDKAAEVSGVEAELIKKLAVRLGQSKQALAISDPDSGNYCNGIASQYIIQSLNNLLQNGKLATCDPDLAVNTDASKLPANYLVGTEEAIAHLNSGNCKSVWIFGVDPVATLPEKLNVAEALKKGGSLVAFSTFENDTTALCNTKIPVQTWLEEWGDRRVTGPGLDVYGVQQPAVSSPWNETRSLGDILATVKNGKDTFFRDVLRGDTPEDRWGQVLARGGVWKEIEDSAWPYPHRVSNPPVAGADPGGAPKGVNLYDSLAAADVKAWPESAPEMLDKTSGSAYLVPFASLALKDGSLSNLPWMMELPDPITTIVWGPWVEMNSKRAEALGIKRHDLVKVTCPDSGLSLIAPAFPLPSVHEEVIAIPVGRDKVDYSKWADISHGGTIDFGKGSHAYGPYGFTNRGYGRPGVNPIKILKPDTPSGEPAWCTSKVQIEKTGKTQMVTAMDTRVFNLPRHLLPAE